RLFYSPGNMVGQWIHWAFVASQSGNYMRIFRNGSPVAEKAGMSPLVSGGGGDLHLGGINSGVLAGELSEVRIWGIARSETDIRAALNGSLAGNEPGLLVYYKLTEGGGRVVNDSAANGPINGALVGNPTWDGPALDAGTALPALGNALALDGVDDYVDVADATWFNGNF